MLKFGEFVRSRRKMLGLSLTAAGKRMGLGKPYLSGIENCKVNPPSPKRVKRMASTLKVKQTPLLLMAYAEKAPAEIREYVKKKLL